MLDKWERAAIEILVDAVEAEGIEAFGFNPEFYLPLHEVNGEIQEYKGPRWDEKRKNLVPNFAVITTQECLQYLVELRKATVCQNHE